MARLTVYFDKALWIVQSFVIAMRKSGETQELDVYTC